MVKWDSFWGCKDGSISINQPMGYTTLTKQKIKTIWSSQQVQTDQPPDKNSTSVHEKNPQQSWHWGNISQHNKVHL